MNKTMLHICGKLLNWASSISKCIYKYSQVASCNCDGFLTGNYYLSSWVLLVDIDTSINIVSKNNEWKNLISTVFNKIYADAGKLSLVKYFVNEKRQLWLSFLVAITQTILRLRLYWFHEWTAKTQVLRKEVN